MIIKNEIFLEKLSLEHLDDMYEYSKNIDFRKALSLNKKYTKEDAKDFLKFLINENKTGKRDYYFIMKNGKAIGTIGLLCIKDYEAEVGFGIAREYWGHNIAGICLDEISKIFFNKYPSFKRLLIGTNLKNKRTQNFALKHSYIECKRTDTHVYFSLSR